MTNLIPGLGYARAGLVTLSVVALVACGGSPVASTSTSGQSPAINSTSNGTPNNSSPSGAQLDPGVSLPSNFPSDFPVYPGARTTTQQATTTSGGITSWVVTWETLDSLNMVQSYYSAQLKQNDWTVTLETSSSGDYSATFARKSNSNLGGLLIVNNTDKPGVTTIALVLSTGS
jgi:hypothetical protein